VQLPTPSRCKRIAPAEAASPGTARSSRPDERNPVRRDSPRRHPDPTGPPHVHPHDRVPTPCQNDGPTRV